MINLSRMQFKNMDSTRKVHKKQQLTCFINIKTYYFKTKERPQHINNYFYQEKASNEILNEVFFYEKLKKVQCKCKANAKLMIAQQYLIINNLIQYNLINNFIYLLLQIQFVYFFFAYNKQIMEIAKIKPTSYVYNKKQMIGKGSFGEVYLGFNQKDHFPVAVKIVSFQKISPVMNKQTLLSKLKQEIVNMQIAQNQYLVSLFDAQVSARNLYIICQYCNGESFDNFLKRKVYLTQQQALVYFKEILKGFQNLHSKKIVHRDLKPANLLMHNYRIKIADLGFSKAIDQHQQLLESIVGTPLYMSPQIFNRQKYTQKTDIWSLGVILFQMLYGRTPWKAKNLLDLKQKVQKQIIEFPQYPSVTLQTKNLIFNMLQLEQQKRVSWQYLFEMHLQKKVNSFNGNQMIDQKFQTQLSKWQKQYQETIKYITAYNYLQSQNQLQKALSELQIKTNKKLQQQKAFLYQNAECFFNSKKFCDEKQQQILTYSFYYFTRRNRICYLFRIFEYIYELSINHQRNTKSLASISFYTCLLLIIKFALHSLKKMLNRSIDNQKEMEIIKIVQSGPVPYPQQIKTLLENDYKVLFNLYDIFFSQFYLPRLNTLKSQNKQLYEQVNKQLSGLYQNQIGDYKFVKFMLGNNLRQIFNQLKAGDLEQTQLILTRMIYEFQKNKKLFQLGDLIQYHKQKQKNQKMQIKNQEDLNKKFNEWKIDEKWNKKIKKQLEPFQIESISTFISKQFKWNPLKVYATDILF